MFPHGKGRRCVHKSQLIRGPLIPLVQPGIAMVSTGPHWESERFKPIDEEGMKKAYREVVCFSSLSVTALFVEVAQMRAVHSSVFYLPSNIRLHAYYRSTLPGHENCYQFRFPVSTKDGIAKNPAGRQNHTYNWAAFPELNEFAGRLWGSLLSDQEFETNIGTDVAEEPTLGERNKARNGGIVTRYWDVWNMGATRPDAHMEWTHKALDCLHVRRFPLLYAPTHGI